MRALAIDAHDFSSIRRDGKIYVDKTEFIYRLVGLSFDSKTRHLVDFAPCGTAARKQAQPKQGEAKCITRKT